MNVYFKEIPNTSNFSGHARANLPVTLDNDQGIMYKYSIYIEHNYDKRLKLTNIEKLEHLRKIAEDIDEWHNVTHNILKAVQAESAVAGSAKEG